MREARLAGRLTSAWAAAVFAFAVVPTHALLARTVGEREALTTQVGHFVEFAVLAWLATWWIDARRRAKGAAKGGSREAGRWAAAREAAGDYAIMLGALVLFGVLIEAAQSLLPYRSAQMRDAAIDAAGALVGLLVALSCDLSRLARRGRWRGR